MKNQATKTRVCDATFVELEISNSQVKLHGETSPSVIETIALRAPVRTKFATMYM
jgi:hypothetical protein